MYLEHVFVEDDRKSRLYQRTTKQNQKLCVVLLEKCEYKQTILELYY